MQRLQLLGKQLCHFAFFFVPYAFLQPHTLYTHLAPMINSMEEVMSETIMSFKSNFAGPGKSGSIHFYHTRDLLQVLYKNSCNFKVAYWYLWRHSGLMVSALDSGLGGPGSSPGPLGHCVVFLGKTLYSHSASLHPGVQMGTSKCAGGNPAMD